MNHHYLIKQIHQVHIVLLVPEMLLQYSWDLVSKYYTIINCNHANLKTRNFSLISKEDEI